jgi:hypothetical protein
VEELNHHIFQLVGVPCHAEISPSLRVGFPREMVGLWQLYPEILACLGGVEWWHTRQGEDR